MSQWSYVTVKELRTQSGATKKDDAPDRDNIMLAIGVAVSQFIDTWTARSFRVYSGVRTFTPEWEDKLAVPDLLSITSIHTDDNLDGTYETLWTDGVDYYLGPLNAALDLKPYTHLRVKWTTRVARGFFPGYPAHVQIDGKWGYRDDRTSTGATLSTAVDTTTQTEIGVDVTDNLSAGMTLYIGSEQLFVRSVDTVNSTITVDRGQNGATAATHSSGVTLYRQEYPAAIRQAALLHANRIYSREKTPLGIINMPGDVGWRAVYIPQFDMDMRSFMQGYRRGGGFV